MIDRLPAGPEKKSLPGLRKNGLIYSERINEKYWLHCSTHMSRSKYIFTSFDILIPYKNIAAVLTVAIRTISLVNHKSVCCQKNN